jgi:heterodisulfide reductase subunit A-like polyferredoxin
MVSRSARPLEGNHRSAEPFIKAFVCALFSTQAPQLQTDLQADTVVVGSGIAGLATAYELSVGQKVGPRSRAA